MKIAILIISSVLMIGFLIFAFSGKEIVEKKVLNDSLKIATFAGGCFWCMEGAFQPLDGVEEVISGYTGGNTENPKYEEVLKGDTGHLEAVQIFYDPKIISYEELLDRFWKSIDPTDDGGQFSDRGSQYLTAIFYNDENEKKTAEKSKLNLENSGKFDKPIVTEIFPTKTFYKAEEYHQDYYKKRTAQYKIYETVSGRKGFIDKTWGKE